MRIASRILKDILLFLNYSKNLSAMQGNISKICFGILFFLLPAQRLAAAALFIFHLTLTIIFIIFKFDSIFLKILI